MGGAIASGNCAHAQVPTAIKREAEPNGQSQSPGRGKPSLIGLSHHTAFCLPDVTLGAESSARKPTNVNGIPSEQIDGGLARGANLFHSFDVFSIPTGGEASFNNALDIQNIISRVTGASLTA